MNCFQQSPQDSDDDDAALFNNKEEQTPMFDGDYQQENLPNREQHTGVVAEISNKIEHLLSTSQKRTQR